MPDPCKPKVIRRGDQFATRIATRIWQETPTADNPYLSSKQRCYGYDLSELIEQCSLVEVLFLLFRGELPDANQRRTFEKLLIGCINPGPRHDATRAAMNAAVGRTHTAHILPIALSIAGGAYLGGEEVSQAMRFLRDHLSLPPAEVASKKLRESVPPAEGDWHIAPGFGSRYGAVDPQAATLVKCLCTGDAVQIALAWGNSFVAHLQEVDLGWLTTGVMAAALLDLGFHPRAGAGMFQLMSAPGLLAHGLEFADRPITAMPFLDSEHYLIDDAAKKKS